MDRKVSWVDRWGWRRSARRGDLGVGWEGRRGGGKGLRVCTLCGRQFASPGVRVYGCPLAFRVGPQLKGKERRLSCSCWLPLFFYFQNRRVTLNHFLPLFEHKMILIVDNWKLLLLKSTFFVQNTQYTVPCTLDVFCYSNYIKSDVYKSDTLHD